MTYAQLLRTYPRYLAFGFLHFFFSAVGQTFFVSLFLVGVTTRMGWASGTFATYYSAATLAAALTLPTVGAFVDRLRARWVSTAAAAGLLVGLAGLIAATHYAWPVAFAAALYVVRLGGQGVLPTIGSTVIGRFFTAYRGKALSLTVVGTAASEIAIPPVATAALLAYGPGAVWGAAMAVIACVFLPAIWLLVPGGDAFQRAGATARPTVDGEAQRSWTRAEVFRDPRFRLVLLAYLLTPFTVTGVVFNQQRIAQLQGYDLGYMAVAISAYGLARGAVTLLGGGLVDGAGPERLLRFAYAPLLAGLACLAAFDGGWAAVAALTLAGVTAGVESVLWPALLAARYGPAHLGRIKSAVRPVAVFSTALAPVLFSRSLDLIGVQATAAAALAVGAIAVALVYRQ